MAYLGKKYNYEKHEKFDEFLGALGVPKASKDAILSHSSSQTLVKNGDTYTLTMDGHEGVKTLTFKSGDEVDEKVGSFDAKTTFTVDGNVVVQTQKFPDGRSVTFKKEYSDNKLVVAATNSEWNGVAYRYYTA
ncbi:fatty acid-binding protein 1-like [Choristoneura fumiferana]|uniref:fatty acid-binding protein 1-like n=1 Tax=Choristoneura fumiferana TaxID=7141 RepID=UPI003D15DADF